jgi:Tol biopolymer transport system component
MSFAVVVCWLAAGAAPAGATIAYEKSPNTAKPSIWVANDDGTGQRLLAGGSQGGDGPVIAPDGSAVLFASRGSRHANPSLRLVPSAGGAIRTIGHNNDGSYVWSPNSKTIAAILGGTPDTDKLVLIDGATGASRTVVAGNITGLSFSPDSTRLAFSRARQTRGVLPRADVYTVPVAGGTPTAITTNHSSDSPVWGPKSIAYVSYRKPARHNDGPKGNVFLMNPDGSGKHQLTHIKAPFLLTGPFPLQWSNDGTRLLGQYGGQDTEYGLGIDPSTGKVHTFSFVRAIKYGLVAGGISQDGSTVIGATGGFDPGGHHDVVTVPWGGGATTVVIKNALSPTWTR